MDKNEQNTYIVAGVGSWNKAVFEKLSHTYKGKWFFTSSPKGMDALLKTCFPTYIFFIHWRWIVSKSIVNNYTCICFHMTDLPYGRGGTPLQNLIVRGHAETILTAFRMEEGLDTGPVYIKRPLSLRGNAKEIYSRASALSWEMIAEIIRYNPTPKPQEGKVVTFKRRTPDESKIPIDTDITKIYDYIRMLDAPGYPTAFLDAEKFRFEFTDAKIKNNEIYAKVRITDNKTFYNRRKENDN